MNPLSLSVVTCTFRDPAGLQATIQSLAPLHQVSLNQDRGWEHVVVDASPEQSEGILRALPPGWPLRHLKEPPRGIYAALNSGAKAAQGELVWFLNGGDRLKSASELNALLSMFQTDPKLALVCAGADLVRDGNYLYPRIPAKDLLNSILGTNRICHQAMIYRLSAFREVGDFDTGLKLAADYDHHFRFYLSGLRSVCVPNRFVDFDMSGSSSNYKQAFVEFEEVHRRYRKRLPKRAALLNELIRRKESAQVRVVKALAASPMAAALRPLWVAWHRLKASDSK